MPQPQSIDELSELIRAADNGNRLLAVGARTKPRLSETDAQWISMTSLRGITSYEPSEFTFSALAGTPVRDVQQRLSEHGQYLPFDPMLVESGSTLGGTVAAGLNGSGRYRYGGIRDFLIGARLITGDGRLINTGGKVVKNAAGFDIPKLMVGSLGRLGVLCELTFKVFPRFADLRTVRIECDSHEQAVETLMARELSRWELDALDYRPRDQAIYLRVAIPEESNDALVADITCHFGNAATCLDHETAKRFWNDVSEFNWVAAEPILVKAPVTPETYVSLQGQLDLNSDIDVHVGAGFAVAWLSIGSASALDEVHAILTKHAMCGLVVRGKESPLWLGCHRDQKIDKLIKTAMDPTGRFPDF